MQFKSVQMVERLNVVQMMLSVHFQVQHIKILHENAAGYWPIRVNN